ncbi:polyribonucleotide nucleotidyltransferase [Patescibacteria group bacterium]|nr:polyribonucleotide nucleotidyltransferase [Patescibacteria group bacterium]
MKFTIEIGEKELIVKTGEVAGQANGSCIVQYGETTVLATAVLGEEEKEIDYFPLSVEYEEKFYAAGRIKGSRFIKRETRPPDEAILTGRLIDRSIRPFFNEESRRAVQVVLTVLSVDQENDPDIVSLWGAAIALSISDIAWDGPISGVRVSRTPVESEKKSEWILNPSYEDREKSDLELIVCGTKDRIIMLDAEAKEIDNKVTNEAIKYGLSHLEEINKFIKSIQKKVGKEKTSLVADLTDEDFLAKQELKRITKDIIEKEAPKYLFEHVLKTKKDRIGAAEKIRARLDELLIEKQIGKEKRQKMVDFANKLIYRQVSQRILDKDQRIDGRQLDEIRVLDCQVGILPRVHGSALFSRGETQTLSIVTLAAPGSEQYLDTMEGEGRKRFMHHYNFPPYCSGEVRNMRSTSRREVGHGALAEKGILPILPKKEDFPHTIRIVSESLSSNGSTSMGAVCASVLAAMDAGIPIKKPVAGIAIGLASEEDEKGFKRYKLLTDIQDLEDGPGGMDFKVIGTAEGITAIQMDTKTNGINLDIVEKTLVASSKARQQVLEKMTQVLSQSRAELSPYAPKIMVVTINPDKIRDVVGAGGKVINEIIKQTGAMIDIEQDGTVSITSDDNESLKRAVQWIKDIAREFKVGEIFQGKVVRIMDFGAFVELVSGQDGMVHVSEMEHHHVKHPDDVVKIGDIVPVKIIKIDQGKISLSMKALKERPAYSSNNSDKPLFRRPFRPKK